MCNSKVEKEDIFINQNSVAAENNAYIKELKFHASTTNILLLIILLLMSLFIIYVIWRVYRKMHHRWVQQGIHQYVLRGSFRRQRATLHGSPAVAEQET